MQEGLVKIFPLKGWHAAIFSCFAVEGEVCGEDRSTDDGSAVEEALGQRSGIGRDYLTWLLDIGAAEGLLEGVSRFRESGEDLGVEVEGFGRGVECSGCGCCSFGKLFQAGGEGKRSTVDESHGC